MLKKLKKRRTVVGNTIKRIVQEKRVKRKGELRAKYAKEAAGRHA